MYLSTSVLSWTCKRGKVYAYKLVLKHLNYRKKLKYYDQNSKKVYSYFKFFINSVILMFKTFIYMHT